MVDAAAPSWIHYTNIVLRVPPLFMLDAALNRTTVDNFIFKVISKANGESDLDMSGKAVIVLVYAFIIVLSFLMFCMPRNLLLQLYSWFVLAAFIGLSYYWNATFISAEIKRADENSYSLLWNLQTFDSASLEGLVENVIVQFTLACLYYNAYSRSIPYGSSVIAGTFFLPCLLRLCLLPRFLLIHGPSVAIILPLLQVAVTLAMLVKEMYECSKSSIAWARYVLTNYGIQTLVESQWQRIKVPQVLRLFWVTRLIEQASFAVLDHVSEEGQVYMSLEKVYELFTYLMYRGCETLVALLGMTSVLSSVAHHIGCAIQFYLDSEDDEDKSIGTVSAILFFILALQTDLPGLAPQKRLVRLYRNVCLLATAILHFVHNMVNPLLMALSASHNRSWKKHIRALSVCFLLVLTPITFLWFLWARHTLNTWLFAVTAFCIEVIIKVIITLLIYSLFMIDAYHSFFWEQLDDYVYYIKATGNTIEFIFGIILFCNGAWIMVFESGGSIRATMMCIHAYFNIWNQAREGWKTFMKRRTAVHKIALLPEASPAQIAAHNDVCAICYQELKTARITKCLHLFHSICLRKWLYVQDNCPLCHAVLYTTSADGAAHQVVAGDDGDRQPPALHEVPPPEAPQQLVPPQEPAPSSSLRQAPSERGEGANAQHQHTD